MAYNYICTEQTLENDYIGSYKTFGIELGGTMILNDISCNKSDAEKIVSLLNKHGVSPVHVKEIAEELI